MHGQWTHYLNHLLVCRLDDCKVLVTLHHYSALQAWSSFGRNVGFWMRKMGLMDFPQTRGHLKTKSICLGLVEGKHLAPGAQRRCSHHSLLPQTFLCSGLNHFIKLSLVISLFAVNYQCFQHSLQLLFSGVAEWWTDRLLTSSRKQPFVAAECRGIEDAGR